MESKGNILVIDDEVGIREGCRRVLEQAGFIVDTAASFKVGLEKIQSAGFDMVLLDIMMPDGRGIDLLRPIHEKDPDTVCVIITGYASVELAVEAIKQGAYDFISKPFTADLLQLTVTQGLEKRRLTLEAKRLQSIEQEAAELARVNEEMERLNAFKSAFMVMVAHELRSPVSGAQSLVRTLSAGLAGELSKKQFEILSRVEMRLDSLLELINDLLTLAASKTAELEKPGLVAYQPVIKRIVDRLSVAAREKNITLTVSLPEKPRNVNATEDGLEKIMGNLIGNAIKYTPSGGQVKVEVNEDSDHVQMRVSDTGMGIPENALPHIWDEFFRAGNARKSGITGTGLGLSIVKQFVDHYGGQIAAQSEEGKGAVFTLTLLLAKNG
jgi:signal transduction histidine kinase